MNRGHWWFALAIVGATWVGSAAVYSRLPERIPTHWNIRGEVDGWGSRPVGAFAIPAGMTVLLGVFAALPWLSPAKFDLDRFRPTYLLIVDYVMLYFLYVHALTLAVSLGYRIEFPRALLGGMFLFFAALGNLMGKIKRNFYVGIRVPWTLASDRVWNDTHRMAAWVWVACGAIGFVLAIAGFLLVSLVPLFVAIIVPILYSFVHSKRLEAQGKT